MTIMGGEVKDSLVLVHLLAAVEVDPVSRPTTMSVVAVMKTAAVAAATTRIRRRAG